MSKKNRTSKSNGSQNSQNNRTQANNNNNNRSNNNLAHDCSRENCSCTKNNRANEL